MEHYYNLNLVWKEGRTGELFSDELEDKLMVATPPPFPQGKERVWSPEHLLTAAVSSCFMTTFLAIAENSKLSFSDFSCDASGKLEQIEGKYLITEISLMAKLTIREAHEMEKTERILQKSEAACLISNSIKSKVILTTEIIISN